ncbi:ribonuclease H-like domain-containing protein [Tanacetum coccineum]
MFLIITLLDPILLISDEQIATLISLIKENSVNGKGFEGRKNSGDWLGHPAHQVLDVLKSTLNFENKESDLMCDTCKEAKQTREPFPLSDHVSTELGKLVHLDLWGPYKVVYSREVKFFEDIFPFKQNMSTKIDTSVQDVNHLNFFNTNTLDDLSDMHNDEERRNPSPNRHSNSPSHSGSPSASSKGNDGGHFQDADAFTALEENNSSSEEASQHMYWVDAMNAEMDALYRNNTWELADLLAGRKPIGSKWVFKIKYKFDGEIERFKARLDAKVYVDDIIITGNNLPEINKVKQFLKTKFMIKDLGKLKYFLGIEVLDTSNGVLIVPYEAFACSCGAGDVVLRESYKPKTRGSLTPPRYYLGASTSQSYSLGTLRNAECSNCKHLLDKITILEATVDMYMHPEQHTVNSAALFHEVYNNMRNLIWSSLSFVM